MHEVREGRLGAVNSHTRLYALAAARDTGIVEQDLAARGGRNLTRSNDLTLVD